MASIFIELENLFIFHIKTNKLPTINPTMPFHTLLSIISHDDVEIMLSINFYFQLKAPFVLPFSISITKKKHSFFRLNKILIWYLIDFFFFSLMPNASLRSLNHRKVINLIEQFFPSFFFIDTNLCLRNIFSRERMNLFESILTKT